LENGKKCPVCSHINVSGAFRCGACNTDVEFVYIEQYPESDFTSPDSDIDHPKPVYESEYRAARAISSLLSFVGWLLFVAGIIAALQGVSVAWRVPEFSVLTMAIPGIGISLGGLVAVAAAQVTRATVDNADHTREILVLLKGKLKKHLKDDDEM